jgi:uncharacterized protein YndB with AHSA1/START domain
MSKTVRKNKALSITRIFDAPRELVWKACTDPELAKRWWGPRDFTAPLITLDLRVGGKYLYDMRSPDGKDFWSTGLLREIVPLEKLVYTDNFADEEGNIVPASYYGMAGEWPDELLVTITFEDQNGKTRFTLVHEGMPPGDMTEQAKAGWNESFDKLEKVLEEENRRRAKNSIIAVPGTQEVTLTRVFDAPRERLVEAFTNQTLIPFWWGPANLTTIVDKLDARSGGVWRFVQRDAEGNEYAFHGVYHEVSPKRIVQTFEWEGMPGHVTLDIATFEELGGTTKLFEKSIAESVEDAEGMLASGMLEGWRETVDRLAELVERKWETKSPSASQPKGSRKGRAGGAKTMRPEKKMERMTV